MLTPEVQQVAIDLQDIGNFSEQAWQEITQEGNPTQARELLSQAERRAEQTKQALKQLPDNTQTREQAFALETKICTIKDRQSTAYSSDASRKKASGKPLEALPLQEKAVLLARQDLACNQGLEPLLPAVLHTPANIKTIQNDIQLLELNIAMEISDLAVLYQTQSRQQDAQPLLDESRHLLEQSKLRPEELITAQHILAIAYQTQGDFKQAEILLTAAQKTAQQTYPEGHSEISNNLYIWGWFYFKQKKYAEAEQAYQRCLRLAQQNNDLAMEEYTLSMLISLYDAWWLTTKKPEYMEKTHALQKRLDQMQDSPNRPPQPDYVTEFPSLTSLNNAYQSTLKSAELDARAWKAAATGQYAEARQYAEQNLADADNHLPPGQTGSKTESLRALAYIESKTNQFPKALETLQQIYALFDAHPSDDPTQESGKQDLARRHLAILRDGLDKGQLKAADILPEAFYAAQIVHGTKRLQAFRQLAMRLAAEQPAIRIQLQTLFDQQAHLKNLEAQYTTSLTAQGATGAENATSLYQQIQQTIADIQQKERDLQTSFPAYAQLAHPAPLPLAQAQVLLQPDEALMVWVENNVKGSKSYLLMVRHDRPPTFYALKTNQAVMTSDVAELRQALAVQKGKATPPAFELNLAHGLYQALFAPAEPDLDGVKHIIAVPDSAMHDLPLSLLVKDSPPDTRNPRNADYANADWLLKHYSISYLPSVRALADLNQPNSTKLATDANTRTPFLGIGDPLFKGQALQLATRGVAMSSDSQQGNGLGFFPDTSIFKELSPLPETGTELHDIAQHLGADPKTALYLQDKASEPMVKQLSDANKLAQARIISFATHAWLPDQQQEAGLVLTTPDHGTAEDDGYLSASEVATLKLNADWVLLSACNTATLADTDTQAGLSSLSKGFFMAGARSVLASLWSVNSQATAQLMPHLFDKLQGNPQLRRDEALQLTLLDMIKEPAPCHWRCHLGLDEQELLQPAHPYYWSPFVIYGEGGSIR